MEINLFYLIIYVLQGKQQIIITKPYAFIVFESVSAFFLLATRICWITGGKTHKKEFIKHIINTVKEINIYIV